MQRQACRRIPVFLANLYLVLALLLNAVPFSVSNDFAYERVDWPLPAQVPGFFSPLASISPEGWRIC
jgi:hypothetical protein